MLDDLKTKLMPLLLGRDSGAMPDMIALIIEGSWAYYSLSEKGTARVAQPAPDDCNLMLRASKYDVTVNPGGARGKRLNQRVRTAVREANVSFRHDDLMYATAKPRASQLGLRVAPLVQVMNKARKEQNLQTPAVLGLMVGEGGDALTIVWVIQPTGVATDPFVSVGHDEASLDIAVEESIQLSGLAQTDIDVHWVTGRELYALCQRSKLRTYPQRNEFYGVPRVTLATGWAIFGGLCATYGGYMYLAGKAHSLSATQTLERAQARPNLTPKIEAIVGEHAGLLAGQSSIDYRGTIAAARAIHTAGSIATMSAQKTGITLRNPAGRTTARVDISVRQARGNQPSDAPSRNTSAYPDGPALEAALSSVPPEGWRRTGVQMDQRGSVVSISYAMD